MYLHTLIQEQELQTSFHQRNVSLVLGSPVSILGFSVPKKTKKTVAERGQHLLSVSLRSSWEQTIKKKITVQNDVGGGFAGDYFFSLRLIKHK